MVLDREFTRLLLPCDNVEDKNQIKLGMAKRVSPPRVWPAKMRDELARPAKLLRARIPNPPRIRAGSRASPRSFYFKLNIFFYILFLKNCQIKPIYLFLSNLFFFSFQI